MVSAVRKVWSTAVTGCFRLSHTHSHTQQLHSLCLCVCVCFWSASSTVPQRLAFPRTKPLVKIQTFHYTVLEIQYSITVKPPFETELSLKHTHIRPGLFWSVLPSCWLCVCARGFDVFWLEAFAVCVCVCVSSLFGATLDKNLSAWIPAVMRPAIWWFHYLWELWESVCERLRVRTCVCVLAQCVCPLFLNIRRIKRCFRGWSRCSHETGVKAGGGRLRSSCLIARTTFDW